MALRKYQSVEQSEVLPKAEQEVVEANIRSLGKTSARELTDEERAKALDTSSVQ